MRRHQVPLRLLLAATITARLLESLRRRSRKSPEPARRDPLAATLPEIAERLATVELASVGGDGSALRERHLSDAVKHCLGRRVGKPVTAAVLVLPQWPRLGRGAVDFVVEQRPGTRSPQHVGELKWCQAGHNKVYEVIWDLFKLALASRLDGVETAHLITGAPQAMWPSAFCGDIFAGGAFTPEELCERRFPRGAKRCAWDDLLAGGFDRHPDAVPATITTRPVSDPAEVRTAAGIWELRAVAVEVAPGAVDVRFDGGWPHGRRPHDARRPALERAPHV